MKAAENKVSWCRGRTTCVIGVSLQTAICAACNIAPHSIRLWLAIKGKFVNLRSLMCAGLVACGMLSAGQALAGGVVTGNIIQIYVRQNDGLVFFALDGVISGRASCAVSNNLWILPMENSDTSKRQYAALLAARAANMPVGVQGSGSCTRWSNSEDVDTLIF